MKKGSLNLSVNAIVVFVLAFALLSVGLGFTYMFREKGQAGLSQLLTFEDLKEPPSAEKPLTVDREITIKRRGSIQADIGYYNKDSNAHTAVRLGINGCYDENGGSATPLPTISAPPQDVDASTGVGYRVIIKEQGLTGGQTYICNMIAYEDAAPTVPIISKQFYLDVGS